MATFKSATLELSQHSTKNSFPYGVEFHKETKIRRVSLQLTDKLLKSHGGIGIRQDFYSCIVTQTVNHNVRFYCQSENNPIVGASLFNPKNSGDLRYRFFTLFDHKSNLLKSDTYKLKHSERTRSVTFSSAQERSVLDVPKDRGGLWVGFERLTDPFAPPPGTTEIQVVPNLKGDGRIAAVWFNLDEQRESSLQLDYLDGAFKFRSSGAGIENLGFVIARKNNSSITGSLEFVTKNIKLRWYQEGASSQVEGEIGNETTVPVSNVVDVSDFEWE